MIKNIAFMGGGVLGSAHPGAMSVMESKSMLGNLRAVAGTSAGSIMALYVSMGFNSAKIKALMDATDYSTFEDGTWLQDAEGMKRFGIHPGKVLLEWIGNQIDQVTGSPYTTFAGFYARKFLDLTVYACNMNTRSMTKFSYATTPNTAVRDAIRASISIPWEFEAYPINGQWYRDGGMIENYPIDTWDTGGIPNTETIGVCFGIDPVQPDNGLQEGEYKKAVKADVELMLAAQYTALLSNPMNLKRSIMVDTLGISPTDFGINLAQKNQLYHCGVNGANAYFK